MYFALKNTCEKHTGKTRETRVFLIPPTELKGVLLTVSEKKRAS